MRRAEQPIVGVFLRLLLQDFYTIFLYRYIYSIIRSIVTSAKNFFILSDILMKKNEPIRILVYTRKYHKKSMTGNILIYIGLLRKHIFGC